MSIVEEAVPEQIARDFLSGDKVLRRWEATPRVKRGELLPGVVCRASPLRREHGATDLNVATWLRVYRAATLGCEGMTNGSWLMGEEEAPQPDTSLRILLECSGQSRTESRFPAGAPEFLAEVCISSTASNLHQKLEVYQEASLQEYLAVLSEGIDLPEHKTFVERLTAPRPA